jgi:hypothetical protein
MDMIFILMDMFLKQFMGHTYGYDFQVFLYISVVKVLIF